MQSPHIENILRLLSLSPVHTSRPRRQFPPHWKVAAKLRVSDKTLRAWEYDQELPTEAQWQKLCSVLSLADLFPNLKTQH
jgi:DNA-binding transcriptional regulator YiaG